MIHYSRGFMDYTVEIFNYALLSPTRIPTLATRSEWSDVPFEHPVTLAMDTGEKAAVVDDLTAFQTVCLVKIIATFTYHFHISEHVWSKLFCYDCMHSKTPLFCECME